MKISNRGDFDGAAWQPFAPTKGWTLAEASGLNYVFAQFRDGAGNESEVESDTIYVGSGPSIVRARVLLPLVLREASPWVLGKRHQERQSLKDCHSLITG